MIGITLLSISSHLYHSNIFERLKDGNIQEYSIPTKENIVLFLNDSILINLRSFMVIMTNYYDSPHFYSVAIITGTLHVASIYYGFLNSLELFIDFDNMKHTFLNIHNLILAIPILCDVYLVFIHSQNEIAIPFLFTNIWIAILFVINPFYKLTHVGFHLLLIVQNYYMCLSNSQTI